MVRFANGGNALSKRPLRLLTLSLAAWCRCATVWNRIRRPLGKMVHDSKPCSSNGKSLSHGSHCLTWWWLDTNGWLLPRQTVARQCEIRDINRLPLNGHGGGNVRIRVIIFKSKILETNSEQRSDIGIDPHPRQRPRLTRQLQPCLVQVVLIQMRIAERVHEIAGLELRHVCDHHRQQGVGSDVKRHT